MCICTHVYMYICKEAWCSVLHVDCTKSYGMCTYVHVCICTHVKVQRGMIFHPACRIVLWDARRYMCTYVHMYICTYTYVYMYICKEACSILHIYIYIYIYTHTHIHTYMMNSVNVPSHIWIVGKCVVWIYICIYIYIYIHTYIWMHTHKHTHTHTYIHTPIVNQHSTRTSTETNPYLSKFHK
jgi:hypothetical protein